MKPGGRRPEAGGRGVAVLALQGDFEAHRKALAEIGVESFEAKRPSDLDRAAGLIIPGGESTTLWKFFEAEPWENAFRNLAKKGRPILGTCAGAIVLARIPRVVFGAWDEKAGAAGSVFDILRERRLNHWVEVYSGVREEECSALLRDFFAAHRK